MFPALLPLSYIPAMLQRTKQLFLSLFQPYIESLVDALNDRTLLDGGRSALRVLGDKIVEERWERIFDRCLKGFEGAGGKRAPRAVPQRIASTASGVTGSDSECKWGCYCLIMTTSSTVWTATDNNAAPQSEDGNSAVTAEEIAKNVQALKSRMKGGRKGRGRDG